MMKSILYQLAKYNPISKPTEIIEVPEATNPEVDRILAQLYPDGMWPGEVAAKIATVLARMPVDSPKWVDVLYPKIIYIIYGLYKLGEWYSEKHTDELFAWFFGNQADKPTYERKLSEASDDRIIRLAMARIVLATYEDDPTRPIQGILPVHPYRAEASRILGLDLNSRTARQASDIQADESAQASIEQLILSRLVYLAVWYSSQGRTRSGFTGRLSTLCLEHKPDVISISHE